MVSLGLGATSCDSEGASTSRNPSCPEQAGGNPFPPHFFQICPVWAHWPSLKDAAQSSNPKGPDHLYRPPLGPGASSSPAQGWRQESQLTPLPRCPLGSPSYDPGNSLHLALSLPLSPALGSKDKPSTLLYLSAQPIAPSTPLPHHSPTPLLSWSASSLYTATPGQSPVRPVLEEARAL